jgi:hypothetical protein
VENANWEKDRTGKEKAPSGMTKAIKNVCKPCNKASYAKYAAHHAATHLKNSRMVLCNKNAPTAI